MSSQTLPVDDIWKARLDLYGRKSPEFYENFNDVRNSPHAGAIRATLKEMGASGVFCVQGVPTVVILIADDYERNSVIELHAALWNQGLASLLLVIADDTVRTFSLYRTPYNTAGEDFERRCLIEILDATSQAIALKNIIYGAESGRLWEEHPEFFRPNERVDQVLLENLTRSHQLLSDANLSSDAAQALLIQTMFVAYLEDRQIINNEYFRTSPDEYHENFSDLLQSGDVAAFDELFSSLRKDFNGDLFVAPSSFEPNANPPRINSNHLDILARFRRGQEDLAAGQLRFWGYNFKHIPIELISAVYDRFLGEREAERREHGAYYTPMFLADAVVSQVWDALPLSSKDKGNFLDPACGSGVFLVRSFQRLCEHWRDRHNLKTIRWDSLQRILLRLHGWDLNRGAVRVAVFSLYVALLEQVSPPDIRSLIKRGKVLPELWDRTIKCQDFFSVEPSSAQVDVVIGNPPWTSRRGPGRSSLRWCVEHKLPMPGKEDAWAFTWKSFEHLGSDGIVAFLLPSMGMLHNHSATSVLARNKLIATTRIKRIVNFADLRFQLFDGASRPAALFIFGKADKDQSAYRFEYWAPKADLNLKIKRLITMSSADKSFITSRGALEDPLIFKRRLWMSEPDAKLFNYLAALPKLGDLISSQRRGHDSSSKEWTIGQGFQRYNRSSGSSYHISSYVSHSPHVSIREFQSLAQSIEGLTPWNSSRVRRKGFEKGFDKCSRILVPRTISKMRLRASYVEEALTFEDIIQAIVVPEGQQRRAKLLTALLNSKVATWYAFHGTASFGSDRPEVKQAELMRLPFPEPSDVQEPERARKAQKALISIIDREIDSTRDKFKLRGDFADVLQKIDQHAYEYFCLSPDEIALIEDTIEFILPSVQPHRGSSPAIWKTTTQKERALYSQTLARTLSSWFEQNQSVNIRLEAQNSDLAILRLTLNGNNKKEPYEERGDAAVRNLLTQLFLNINQPLPGNFQLLPDFRIFQGNNLYLVKPTQRRFWLRSSALADAHKVALDLQQFAGSAINKVIL